MKKLKERADKLMQQLPAVFLSLKDKRTPFYAKILAFITVAYALSPIDLIPDFIPVLGYLDDLIILPALSALTIKLIPKDVYAQNLEKSKGIWRDGKPKRFYYAIPIIIIWIILITLIVLAII